MIIEINITCLKKTSTMLPGAYPYGGKQRTLLDQYRWEDLPQNPPKDKPNPESMNLHFPKTNHVQTIRYEVNQKGEPKDQASKQIQNVVEHFYKNHPSCLNNGQTHKNSAGEPIFDVSDKATEVVSSLREWDMKRKIANYLIDKCDLDAVRDVMFYYGQNPKGKTHGEICMFLSDYELGILYAKGDNNSRLCDTFLKTWIEELDPSRIYLIHARKAISLGIVEVRQRDGNTNYFLNGAFTGLSPEEVADYLKREEKIYKEHVLRRINEKDEFSEEMLATKVEKASLYENASMGQLELDKFRDEIREKMKELSDKGIKHGVTEARIRQAQAPKLREVFDMLEEMGTLQVAAD